MAHAFLWKGEEPSVCIPCDELLTDSDTVVYSIEYILFDLI